VKTYKITEDIFVSPYKGTYKYSVGTFTNYDDARDHANELKAKFGINSFVIAYKNGLRVPDSNMAQVKKQTAYLRQKQTAVTTPASDTSKTNVVVPATIVYRAQIGSVVDAYSTDYFRKLYKITEQIFIDPYQGTYKYSVGTFSTYADARAYANDMKTKYGIDSFVIAFKNGVRISVYAAKAITGK